MISYHFCASIGLFIAISFGMLGYRIGRHHGFDLGHIAGANVERGRTMARVIRLKIESYHRGIHAGMRRFSTGRN